jgi:signal transduction histidine kinase
LGDPVSSYDKFLAMQFSSTHARNLAKFCFGLSILVGLMDLVGWHYHLYYLITILPGLNAMKANTAIGFIALGTAGLLAMNKGRAKVLGMFTLSFFVALMCGLTLYEYKWHVNFGIDEFLFSDPDAQITRWSPGRLSPLTAVNFILLSCAFGVHCLQQKNTFRFSNWVERFYQALVLIVWVISFQALLGYLAGVKYLFGASFYTQMAFHTAALFELMSTGLLFVHYERGFLKIVLNRSLAGRVGRTLLVSAILFPPIMNYLEIEGQILGFWDADFGILIRMVANVCFFAVIAYHTSSQLLFAEKEIQSAALKEKAQKENLKAALIARDDLMSICSHELLTPITAMKLTNQKWIRDFERGVKEFPAEKALKAAQLSEKQLNRLTRLIDDMLSFGKMREGEIVLRRTQFDLNLMILDCLESSADLFLQANIEPSFIQNEPLFVNWDRQRMEQVLNNFLSNAVKYAPNKPVSIEISLAGELVHLSVQDHGSGIKHEDVERIFMPYERGVSGSNISGFGLGLHVVKQIVEAHSGTVLVKSDATEGSNFEAILPRGQAT